MKANRQGYNILKFPVRPAIFDFRGGMNVMRKNRKFLNFQPIRTGEVHRDVLIFTRESKAPSLVDVSFIPIDCDLTRLCVVKDTHVKTAHFGGSGVLVC